MCMAVIVLIAIVIAAMIFDLIRIYISNSRYRGEQRRQYQRLMRENAILRRNAMDAYRSMLREACREGGFWEDKEADANEDAEEY